MQNIAQAPRLVAGPIIRLWDVIFFQPDIRRQLGCQRRRGGGGVKGYGKPFEIVRRGRSFRFHLLRGLQAFKRRYPFSSDKTPEMVQQGVRFRAYSIFPGFDMAEQVQLFFGAGGGDVQQAPAASIPVLSTKCHLYEVLPCYGMPWCWACAP